MTSFWTAVCVHAVYEGAVAEFGDPASLLRNVNAPADYPWRLPLPDSRSDPRLQ